MSKEFITRTIIFPRPFAFVIDDMGWIQGSSMQLSNPRGPYRNGVKRKFDLRDYQAVVDVATAVGVRVQGVFVLSELDRKNVLAKYPTTTYLREKWDNSANINDEQEELVRYVISQSAHLEFGFHGIGHEHWPAPGVQKRAEFYNTEDDHPWPEEIIAQHITAAKEILAQYGLSEDRGHHFPETFVPGAYSYYWNPEGEYSLGKLIRAAGAKYANTNFNFIPELLPPPEVNGAGFDHGLHVMCRLNYGNLWNELQSLPKVTVDMQPTDMAESHWANWLAPDDFLQPQVTAQWINYYRAIEDIPERYLAKNTAQLHAQWLYKRYTRIDQTDPGTLLIDNRAMPDDVYRSEIAGNLVLKFVLREAQHLSSVTLDGKPVSAYFERNGYGYVQLPPLLAKEYLLQYDLGAVLPAFYVVTDGTFSVLDATDRETEASVIVRTYGRQDMVIYCRKPQQVHSNNEQLLIKGSSYDEALRRLTITLEATDYQGVTGRIGIEYL